MKKSEELDTGLALPANTVEITVQTVQKTEDKVDLPVVKKRDSREFYEIATDEDKMWHWCLWAGNGKILARNAEPYISRAAVMMGLQLFRDTVGKAEIIALSHKKE